MFCCFYSIREAYWCGSALGPPLGFGDGNMVLYLAGAMPERPTCTPIRNLEYKDYAQIHSWLLYSPCD
jgi:hypothetical protein